MSTHAGSKDTRSDGDSSLVLEPGAVVAQKYRLERLLKRGGMGAVWVATHLGLDTTVAIKFMNARMLDLMAQSNDDEDDVAAGVSDPRALTLARFEREAKAAARIRSTNVVQMLDHGVDQGTPYIVMELLRGEDLEARLKRVNRLSFEEILPIVNAVARALQLAHAEELVHRDLKPENIFLAKEGDEEIPKILDFGVAKAKNAPGEQEVKGSTSDGTMVGTPHYMSPEQVQAGAHVDHRADLWSLGVVIFRALTGRLPFPSNGLLELAMQICREPVPLVTSIRPDLPPAMNDFFGRALCRDPQKRFQSARELAAALQDIANGRQLIASTSSVSAASVMTNSLPQSTSSSGSRTGLFVLAGLVLAAVLGGAAFMMLRPAPAANADAQASSVKPAATVPPDLPRPPVSIASATTDAAVASSTPSASSSPVATTTAKTFVTKSAPSTTSTAKTKKRNVGY